jgi:chitodextrinase
MGNGHFVLSQLAASAGTVTGTTGTMSAATTTPIGPKRVAVILFNFSNDASRPFTPASVAQTYFATGATDRSVANYYNEVSWGQLQLTGQAVGWYTIPATNQTCDPGTWATQADAVARAAGVDLSAFDIKTYVYPGVSACGWGGLGQMPGNENWINGSPTTGVMVHELGHNLGLNHASAESCTLSTGEKAAYGPNCSATEYGDMYDVMGAAGLTYQLSEWHRAMIGLSDDIRWASTDGTYTLTPLESQFGSPHGLRIPRGDGTSFDLEYRQPYGLFDAFSPSAAAVTGVMIRKVGPYSVADKPLLIDTTPQTPTYADAPLASGQTFVDPTTGIRVTVLAATTLGATVQLDVLAGDFTPPSVSISSPAAGAAVTLPATVSVSASDNLAVGKVELYRNGTLVATRTAAPYDFTWTDGASGSYTLTAVAYDSSNVGSVSTPVSVTATQSDTAAPSSPTEPRSVANAQTQIDAVWTASTDNVGVVYYQLYANGAKMGTTSGTSFSYTGLTCGTGYSLGFAAVDAAGNMSSRKGMSAWTTACSGDTTAPSMPAAPLASVAGPASVSLSWSASVDNVGVTGYRIDRNGVTVGHTTSTSFFDTGLTAGTRYGYSITANDATGNLSGTSAPGYVTLPAGDTEPPSQPTGLWPTSVTGSSVSLSWQAAADNVSVAGYRIYRGGVQIGQTTGTSWTDTGLVGGMQYGYTVVAYDGSGNLSPQSAVAFATTLTVDTVAPTAPANLTASGMKGRKVNLNWAAASDNVGVTGYRVFRDGSLLATVTGSLTFTDSPSRGNHSYCVRAIDAASNLSAASNSVNVRV